MHRQLTSHFIEQMNRRAELPKTLLSSELQVFPTTSHELLADKFLKRNITVDALRHIANSLVARGEREKTDYRVLLQPREGTAPISFFGLSSVDDKLGIRTGFGTMPCGADVQFAFYRRKDGYSSAEKQRGERLIQIENKPVDLPEAIRFITEIERDGRVQLEIESRVRLADYGAYLKNELEMRNVFLSNSCKSNPAYHSLENLLSRYGKAAAEVNALEKGFVEKQAMELERLYSYLSKPASAIKKLLSHSQTYEEAAAASRKSVFIPLLFRAALKWPAPQNDAPEKAAAHFIGRLQMDNAAREAFGKWCSRYAQDVLPKTLGVEFLERNMSDRMDDIRRQFEFALLVANDNQRGELVKNQGEFDRAFHSIRGIVKKIDSVFKRLKRGTGSPEEAFAMICTLADRRASLLLQLEALSPNRAYVDRNCANEIDKALLDMAANLCRVGKEESAMWRELLGKWGGALKSDKAGKAYASSIKEFISASDSECELVGGYLAQESESRKKFKAELTVLKKRRDAIADEASALSAAAGAHLRLKKEETEEHINYKQGERPTQFAKYAYFNRLLCLDMQKDDIDSQLYGEELARALSDNEAILSKIGSINVLTEIWEDIEKMLYTKNRGFDLAPDVGGLKERGYRGNDLEVKYWFSVKTDRNGIDEDVLNLEFHNTVVQIDMVHYLPYDENYKPPAHPLNDSRPLYERIYGNRLLLSDIIGAVSLQDNLGAIYRRLYYAGYGNPGLYESVENDLKSASMQNARYLSTLAIQGFGGGCATNSLGSANPAVLEDGKGDMVAHLKKAYPSYKSDAADVDAYRKMKVARRIFSRLTSNIPYYIIKDASGIAGKELDWKKWEPF